MGQNYLIDTNAIIDFAANKLPTKGHAFLANVIDNNPCISFVNKIELLGFSDVSPSIIAFTQATEVTGISDTIIQQTIDIRLAHKIKLPDAIIAATALTLDMQLITRNEADFKRIEQLNIINPHTL